MKQTVDITLIENSSAGNPPRTFYAQNVEITHEPDTVSNSVDGHRSVGLHPSKITWFGALAKTMENITDVKIVGSGGRILVEGELHTNYDAPRDVDGNVQFLVLRPEHPPR